MKKNYLDREIQRLRIKADADPEHRAELLEEIAHLETMKKAVLSSKYTKRTATGEIIETAMKR